MLPLPFSAVEDALWLAAEGALPAEVLGAGELARAVMDRSRRYTNERERLDERLTGRAAAADLAARATFFAVADAPKIAVPLAELDRRELLPRRGPLRVLDLGAGAGAMTLGTAAYLAGTRGELHLAVVAIDRDREALGLFAAAAGHLAASLGGRIDLDRRTALLDAAPLGRGVFDLVIAGSLLNEIPPAAHRGLVERAMEALAPDGAAIWIEPALRGTSRDLHRLRDAVLAAGVAHVFAPCIRAVGGCPALDDERDWCHEDRPSVLPPRAGRIAVATGLRDSGIKFSYLVLRRAAEPLVAVGERAAVRIVSQPRKQKGRRECVGCGDQGWVTLRLLSRHRSTANRPFDRVRRGDVLVVDRPAAGAAGRPGTRDIGRDEEIEWVGEPAPDAGG